VPTPAFLFASLQPSSQEKLLFLCRKKKATEVHGLIQHRSWFSKPLLQLLDYYFMVDRDMHFVDMNEEQISPKWYKFKNLDNIVISDQQ